MEMLVKTAPTIRFDALWQRCVPSSEDAAAHIRADLVRLYSEPHRRFHTLSHIDDCLSRFDEVDTLMKDPDAVEVALWFHDAIYRPGSPDNEARSVELFQQRSAGAASSFIKRVSDHIMATKHVASDVVGDRGFVVDIDLHGFAEPWDIFMAKGDELRAEHAMQSDDEYYHAQVRFLTRLTKRRFFFCTPYYRARYEKLARENVQRLLKLRTSTGYGLAHDVEGRPRVS